MSRLTREVFQDALKKGLGRAVQHVRNSSPEEVREDLLHACLNSLAYDEQLEGNRAPWLDFMITKTDEPEFYEPRVLERYFSLVKDKIENNDQLQLFNLVCEFAEYGNEKARAEVFRFFDRQCEIEENDGWYYGRHTIIAMCGIRGLLHVLDRFGRRIKENKYVYLSSVLIEDAEEEFGKDEVQAALKMESERNEFIRIYLDHLEAKRESTDEENSKYANESKEERGERIREKYPLREMTDHLLKNDFSRHKDRELFIADPYRYLTCHTEYKFPIAAKWACEEDLSYACDRMMETDDPLRKAILLDTFKYEPLPEVEERFLAMLDSDDDRLVQGAKNALSNTNHPLVREKALELLQADPTPPNWCFGIHLLECNFQTEDIGLLYSAIRTKPFPGDWDLHCVGICLEKIYDKNPIEQFADVFLWLYENGPCSYCREGFVKRLWKMGRLPETILEECLNDCNSDIRKWANAPNEEGEDEEK